MSKHTIDEFGVISWADLNHNDTVHHNYHDPFEARIRILKGGHGDLHSRDRAQASQTAIRVHERMRSAQAIAVSLFGSDWKSHIHIIFRALKDEEDHNTKPARNQST